MTSRTETPLTALPRGSIQVVELDFETREEREVAPEEVSAARDAGRFCWLDIDRDAAGSDLGSFLRGLGINSEAVSQVLKSDYGGRHDYYPDCLHLTLTAGEWVGEDFHPRHVELLVGSGYLITLRPGRVEFMEQVRRHYRQDFQQFAQTPSFLLYDCWDHLVDSYKRLMVDLDRRLEKVHEEIFGEVDDAIFARVSDLTRDLLALRKTVLASREILYDIATRRSPFVAESAQPFLDRLVTTLERMAADLSGEREMLAETLNLYMGMVSHRTNRVVNRLTALSTVFLPLSFLVAVYGTNFDIPEVRWRYGYQYLWGLSLAIAGALLWWMRRRRWW